MLWMIIKLGYMAIYIWFSSSKTKGLYLVKSISKFLLVCSISFASQTTYL